MEIFKLFGSIFIKDNATEPLEKIGKKGECVAQKFKNVGQTIGKCVAGAFTVAAAIGFEKQIVSTYSTYDDQMRKVQAVTGATGKAYSSLQAKAEELGSKTRFSATQAGEGMEALGRAGWNTGQIIDGIQETLTFATANAIDLGQASGIVADGLSQFNMSAKETGRFTDVLSATAKSANTDISLLGESFKYAGAISGSLGYKVEDVSVALGIMANKGIKGSQAGTTLRSALSSLINPTGQSVGAIKELGISITDSQGKVKPFSQTVIELREKFKHLTKAQKGQYASTIFGQQAMTGMLAVINASDEEFKTMTDSINQSTGTTKKMADTMDGGLGGALASVSSAWEGLLIKLGKMQDGILVDSLNGIAKILQDLPQTIENVSNKVNAFTTFIKDHETAIKSCGIAFATLSGGFKLYKLGITGVNGGMAKMLIGLATGTAKTKLLGGIMKNVGSVMGFVTSPIGLVTLGITAIATAVFLIYKNWGSIKTWFSNLFTSISQIFTNASNSIANWFANVFQAIGNWFSNLITSIATFLAPIGQVISNVVKAIFLALKFIVQSEMTLIITVVRVPLELIKGLWETIWGKIGDTVKSIIDKIKNFIGGIINWIQAQMSAQVAFQASIFNKIKDTISRIWNNIKTIITSVVTAISNVIGTTWNGIKNVTSTVFNAIKIVMTTVWNAIKTVIITYINIIKTVITTVWNAIKSVTSTVFQAISNVVGTIWNGIKEKMTKPVEVAKNKIKSILDGIKGFFSNLKIPSIKIPHVKLPHFSLSGEFSLKNMSVPKLSVDWYSTGAIFNKRTILPNGIGVGDKNNGFGDNPEVVAPIDRLLDMFREVLSESKQDIYIQLDGRTIAKASAKYMSVEIANNMKFR